MNQEALPQQPTESVVPEQIISPSQTPSIPDPTISNPNQSKKPSFLRIVYLLGGILFFGMLVLVLFIKNNPTHTLPDLSGETDEKNLNSVVPISPTTTSSITISVTSKPTQKPTIQASPTTLLQPTNTIKPTNTSIPTPTPMPTSTPMPTPTRAPNPPVISIDFPQEGQVVTQSSSQICISDVPSGGDTSGVNRRQNINNGGWTGYASMTTLCFNASTGANSFMLQYKNSHNEESPIYTRNFIYQP